MLYKKREMFEKWSVRAGTACARFGLTPNQWTLLSIIPAVLAAWLLARHEFLAAALAVAAAAFLDIVDGGVARVTGRTTKLGAYLDTVADRYVEFIVVLGLALAALPAVFGIGAEAWLLAYLFGAMMTTYAKAAAKEKGLVAGELRGGLLERAERMGLLVIGILIAEAGLIYLSYAVALLAVLANVSAVQRILIAISGKPKGFGTKA